jgi:hypothetical protein
MSEQDLPEGNGSVVLFFSRGRGRGHALPDIEIAEALAQELPGLTLYFASYATGAETLRKAGFHVIDLGLPDETTYHNALLKSAVAIAEVQPHVVISHEEFGALTAARLCSVPTVFLNDWFPPPGSVAAEAVSVADSIVFIERPGLFAPPPELKVRPLYVGPVVRRMSYSLGERPRARLELGLPADAVVVSVIPGAWATERRVPLFDLVRAAFDRVQFEDREKRLVWVAGDDCSDITGRCEGRDDVLVLATGDPIERVMVASDVGITKGNRGSTMDLAALGIPSISISPVMNQVDEVYVPRIRSNVALYRAATDDSILAHYIMHLVATVSAVEQQEPKPHTDCVSNAASCLAKEIVRLRLRSHT